MLELSFWEYRKFSIILNITENILLIGMQTMKLFRKQFHRGNNFLPRYKVYDSPAASTPAFLCV